MEKLKKIAFIYDFDYTLISGNMQEGKLIEALGVTKEEYWEVSNKIMKENDIDGILAAMYTPIVIAKKKGIKFDKKLLEDAGRAITNFFPGVIGWFDRINKYASNLGLEIEHYIISAGCKEMLDNCSIAKNFTKIFASKYMYNSKGLPIWPAYLVNYTQKTQYIARIQKNLVDVLYDSKIINRKFDKDNIYINYSDMIYFGDGETDVPSMRVIRENGGKSICVYDSSNQKSFDVARRLVEDGRVDCAVLADYSEDGELDVRIKYFLQKLAES